jgi:hypothetical protein
MVGSENNNNSNRPREEQIDFYLKVVQGYMPDVRLRIKRWKHFDGTDNRIRYQLIDEDPDSGGWVTLSEPMRKSDLLTNLITLSNLFARAEKIKWRRYLKAEQEYEAKIWEDFKGGEKRNGL